MPKNECKFNGENEFLISFVLLLFSLILFYFIPFCYTFCTLSIWSSVCVCVCVFSMCVCVCLCRHMRKLMPALAACLARKAQRE